MQVRTYYITLPEERGLYCINDIIELKKSALWNVIFPYRYNGETKAHQTVDFYVNTSLQVPRIKIKIRHVVKNMLCSSCKKIFKTVQFVKR